MAALRCTITLLLVTIIVAAILLRSSEAAYRKPPFNGSIFGKRNALGELILSRISAITI